MRHLILSCLLCAAPPCLAQTGTPAEPVRYVGGEICNPREHEGGLGHVLGVENIQVMRANRTRPNEADSCGWTYNHAPNITYWRGHFYLQYLSNPSDEQQPPGHTLLCTSPDGRTWSRPRVVFPQYEPPRGVSPQKPYYGYIMHQRMGFYTAPDGRLLCVGFYGHSYDPFKEGGIGRVVREIHADGTFGPIYFLRYSSHTTWGEGNTAFPLYTRSTDKGFVSACQALLADRLKTLQWIDEDRGLDGFYALKDSINTVQATAYYHRKDGQVVALWKKSWAALSADGGKTWSKPVRCRSIITAGGKTWGQRTADGRWAMCYNPIETQPYRYPLIITTSDDGAVFDAMAVVNGEVPPRRFFGENKDFGPCYVRGITESEQQPGDSCMWVAYSMNKEDIWVSRIPLPVRRAWTGPVADTFDEVAPGGRVPHWHIYRPAWCPVAVDAAHRLRLADADPYDYARAVRVFEPAQRVRAELDVCVERDGAEPFEVDITDGHGARAACVAFCQGQITLNGKPAGRYTAGQAQRIRVDVDANGIGTATLYIGARKAAEAPCLHAVRTAERLSLRTGAYRDLPDRNTPNQEKCPPLSGCDERVAESSVWVDNVRVGN